MSSSYPFRLTRRGELFRAVSHAVRSLQQVPFDDLEVWNRDVRHFRESIHAGYADVLEHIPLPFQRLLASDRPPELPMTEFLETLSHEIHRETDA